MFGAALGNRAIAYGFFLRGNRTFVTKSPNSQWSFSALPVENSLVHWTSYCDFSSTGRSQLSSPEPSSCKSHVFFIIVLNYSVLHCIFLFNRIINYAFVYCIDFRKRLPWRESRAGWNVLYPYSQIYFFSIPKTSNWYLTSGYKTITMIEYVQRWNCAQKLCNVPPEYP